MPANPDIIMSSQGPVGMGNPAMNALKRLMHRPKDIELPAESGQIDPELMPYMANPGEQMMKAFKAAQELAAGEGPLGGLMQARPDRR